MHEHEYQPKPSSKTLDSYIGSWSKWTLAAKQYLLDTKKWLEYEFWQQASSSNRMAFQFEALGQTTDNLIKTLWQEFEKEAESNWMLLAVGGYGRQQLHPYSDIDIWIISSLEPTTAEQDNLKVFLSRLWDIGFNISQNVYSIKQLSKHLNDCPEMQTRWLEHRLLSRNNNNYQQWLINQKKTFCANIDTFLRAKIKEQTQRILRHQNAANQIEPNIKYSSGGLRSLHTISWCQNTLNMSPKRFSKNILLDKQAREQFEELSYKIHSLRAQLHYLTKQPENRLLLDYQLELAKQLYGDNKQSPNANVEKLMRQYYCTAHSCSILCNKIMQQTNDLIFIGPPLINNINDDICIINHHLGLYNPSIIISEPNHLMPFFDAFASEKNINEIHIDTSIAINRCIPNLDTSFFNDSSNQKHFLNILNSKKVFITLSLMHSYGLLKLCIPSFGRVLGQMQYDLFHVYTVDQHTLRVVHYLELFTQDLPNEHILCQHIIARQNNSSTLVLAAIFHDLGKGLGGDHSSTGAELAKTFCKQLSLPPVQTESIIWLVQNHLLLSSVAQRKDISDPQCVYDFVKIVKTKQRLDLLYVLTIADILGTNQKLYNDWRKTLFQNLYYSSYQVLEQHRVGYQSPFTIQRQAIKQIKSMLKKYNQSIKQWQQYWHHMQSTEYINHFSVDDLWLHYQEYKKQDIDLNNSAFIYLNTKQASTAIDLFIAKNTKHSFFAVIASLLDRQQCDIVEAKIMRTSSGMRLESYTVLAPVDFKTELKHLYRFIHKVMQQNMEHFHLSHRRLSRQLKSFKPFATINFDFNSQQLNYQLKVLTNNRPGLLGLIGLTLNQFEIEVKSARILTLGERVEDIFIIESKQSDNLIPLTIQNSIKENLEDTILNYT